MQQLIASLTLAAQSMSTARERARQVGEVFGLETLQRTRFVTAVSEIARNTVEHAGEGTLEFMFDMQPPGRSYQCLVAQFKDKGPGIANFRDHNANALALDNDAQRGIAAARRLVDHLSIDCPEQGGTVVRLEMGLPRSHKPLSIVEVQARGSRLNAFKALTPLEELEQQNREMLVAMEQLRRRQQELELADVRKNEFMAMLAHELRNPMATLNMNLMILRRKPAITVEELAQRRDVMGRQVDQMVRMVDDLTDVTRVEKGKVELQETALELNALVRDALEMTASAILERQHTVSFQAAPADLWLHGDPSRLLQVFANVIQNAAKYTPPGGRIDVAVRGEGNAAVVDVTDNGMGISPEMLPNIFGLFVQAQKRSGDGNAGLGVGLTLAERLVRDHGGSITVASGGLGQGSQFSVRLPLKAQIQA